MIDNQNKGMWHVLAIVIIISVFLTVQLSIVACKKADSKNTEKVPRVSAEKARESNISGNSLLVCAYDNEDKCNTLRLDGAMTLQEFETTLPTLPKEKEIIFYCT